ncbi:hypothetical protein MTBLM5_590003 [Magnetospirillum sp. LM-5]|uniref:hypothetical protein n=1 Tax=Magnetospirillum sp. LM-5 TaxID=2681466 RepID=UPI00137ED542|nr:hypothetical protein [Magnetospirillum sp. LM-5]CAA7623751.1 hypothetical protein MTBLM5_590003 [Magnetospirillum sp. LM-5]
MKSFKNSREWRAVSKALIGTIGAGDYMFSKTSGHGMHKEVALFFRDSADFAAIDASLCSAWVRCCRAIGLRCSPAHGFDLRQIEAGTGVKTAEYMLKVSDPGIAIAAALAGKLDPAADSWTAWDLSAAATVGCPDFEFAGRAWVEFVGGVKGFSRCRWSTGLAEHFCPTAAAAADGGVMDMESGEVIEIDTVPPPEAPPKRIIYASIKQIDYRRVRRHRFRSQVLKAAEEDGQPGVNRIIQSLIDRDDWLAVWRSRAVQTLPLSCKRIALDSRPP